MLEAWIPIAIFAAFFQNLRSALQKHLKGKLSNNGAAYARFLYALPFAFLYVFVLHHYTDRPLPSTNLLFYVYCFLGSVSQILFTALLLWMFSFRSFAVGTTFSKLEVVVVAILGAILLGDTLNATAITAIMISALGVIALSSKQAGISLPSLVSRFAGKETVLGLLCALFLGGSVVFFRGAALSLQHDDNIMAAAFTLLIALNMQTFLMGIWLAVREPDQWGKLATEWRWASVVGITGILASIGWFTAFTLQNASYVRALGQVELLFTFFFSARIFKEKITRLEVIGISLVAAGIIMLLLLE